MEQSDLGNSSIIRKTHRNARATHDASTHIHTHTHTHDACKTHRTRAANCSSVRESGSYNNSKKSATETSIPIISLATTRNTTLRNVITIRNNDDGSADVTNHSYHDIKQDKNAQNNRAPTSTAIT